MGPWVTKRDPVPCLENARAAYGPSEARVEVDDDADVEQLTDDDRLLGRRRARVVAQLAVLLHPAEHRPTASVVLAPGQVVHVQMPVARRYLAAVFENTYFTGFFQISKNATFYVFLKRRVKKW